MYPPVYSKSQKIKIIYKNLAHLLLTRPLTTCIILLKSLKKSAVGSRRIFINEILLNFLDEFPINDDYSKWLEMTDTDLSVSGRAETTFEYSPRISIIVPLYNTPEKFLRLMIESVLKQRYKVWELCLADDASTDINVEKIVREYMQDESRIKFLKRSENGHISEASNSALSLATGEFIALLDHDDEIAADALYWMVKELNEHPEADLIYSDEDKITEEGKRYSPIFKPDWDFYLFTGNNIVNHLGVYRRNIIDQIGGFRTGFEGSQDYDLILRFIDKTTPDRIRHIPRVLYHWRSIKGSVSDNIGAKLYAFVSAKKALADYFWKKNIPVKVSDAQVLFLHKVEFQLLNGYPPVSILIYGEDNRKLQMAKSEMKRMINYLDYKISEFYLKIKKYQLFS